ncbi:Sorting nexin 1, partial [Linum grandiflorum]
DECGKLQISHFPTLSTCPPISRLTFHLRFYCFFRSTNSSKMDQQQRSSSASGYSHSPRSPSSQQPYLSVSITDPVKLGNGVQAYISYRVITKTNLPDYQGPEKIVIRRYSDFVWLHDRLFEKYKGVFIPPLPEKSAVEKFRFSAEFIEMRRQALDVFVNRIASHQELQQSEDLRTFLQAEEETMERLRSQELSYFKKPADLLQIFKDVQSKVSDVVLGKEKPLEESNPEYEKMKHYIFELENHLAEAQKHAYRLVKRHRGKVSNAFVSSTFKEYSSNCFHLVLPELGQSLSDFGKATKLLGACEGDVLGKALSDLGAKSEALSLRQLRYVYFPSGFIILSCILIKLLQQATFAERATAFRHQCELSETMKLKEINLDKLMLMRSDRVGEAEYEYRELKADSEEAARKFETIVRRMNEEIVRFQEQKTIDMGKAFHEFAKGQARLANGIADGWRSLLPKLEACSV